MPVRCAGSGRMGSGGRRLSAIGLWREGRVALTTWDFGGVTSSPVQAHNMDIWLATAPRTQSVLGRSLLVTLG